jgi:hypothetical protein
MKHDIIFAIKWTSSQSDFASILSIFPVLRVFQPILWLRTRTNGASNQTYNTLPLVLPAARMPQSISLVIALVQAGLDHSSPEFSDIIFPPWFGIEPAANGLEIYPDAEPMVEARISGVLPQILHFGLMIFFGRQPASAFFTLIARARRNCIPDKCLQCNDRQKAVAGGTKHLLNLLLVNIPFFVKVSGKIPATFYDESGDVAEK